MIIDATDLIAGRLATFVAKKALLGEKIDIVNSEKSVMSGTMDSILAKYKRKVDMGTPAKGPFFHRMPDRFLRRIIRNMLPYKQEKGRQALQRIMCHIGIPDSLKEGKPETIEKINASKLPNTRYVQIGKISKLLGAKI